MKIGIVSLYYKSLNYGGNLQAYALCQYFKKKGIYAEQLNIDNSEPINVTSILKKMGGGTLVKKILSKIKMTPYTLYYICMKKRYKKEFESAITERKVAFYEFKNQIIPNNSEVYNAENTNLLIDKYDVFIAGSDQIWNLGSYIKAVNLYYLDFVPSNKVKLSYAASNTMKTLNVKQIEAIKKSLSDYKAISVREQSTVELFGEFLEQEPVLVVDPTLLLDDKEWDEVCYQRMIEGSYIFCYFLGTNRRIRKLVRKFAEMKKMKTVEISYASGNFELINGIHADIILNDVSPQKFLSLIKYSQYICTDSFHAVVFSFIYKKQFFVFNRNKKASMSNRIKNIIQLFDMEERFCENRNMETLNYLSGLKEIDYTRTFNKFDDLRDKSFRYIDENVLSHINAR